MSKTLFIRVHDAVKALGWVVAHEHTIDLVPRPASWKGTIGRQRLPLPHQ
jgi:hypothetical protein